MSRENEFYRGELEGLLEHFGPNKNILRSTDVARYCGINRTTAKAKFCIGKDGIPLRKLALLLSRM